MNLELRIYDVGSEQRWKWLQYLDSLGSAGADLGRFLSFRDDATLVRICDGNAAPDAFAAPPSPIRERGIRKLAARDDANIKAVEDVARLRECAVLEIRQYRIAAAQRARFATFFRDRTLPAQLANGMSVYGPFDDVEDENRFVWFRGFPGLVERDRRKAAFYESALWLDELQDEAFTMIEDYSDVLLVTPV
jgi:hypothetical protein